MRVKLVYRNYKPLHKIYESLVKSPPEGVDYIVPPTYHRLQKLYPLSRKLRYFAPTRTAIHVVENSFFLKNDDASDIDIYHYINIMDENPPDKPYVLDIEHAASLISFTHDKKRIKKAITFLKNPNCKAVNCLSEAAKRSLVGFTGDDYKSIADKVQVIYPAMKIQNESTKPDYRHISKDTESLKLLFVGTPAYLKGLEEILIALANIDQSMGEGKIELFAISNDAEKLFDKYKPTNAHLYPPKFSKEEILSQFFLPADVFIMPTKEDTFGMAILDSLVCGTPVITTSQFALPELVSDGVDGLLIKSKDPLMDRVLIPTKEDIASVNRSNIDPQLIKEITTLLKKIINKNINISKLRGAGIEKFKKGQKFSVDTRNSALLKIYNKALVKS